MVEKVSTSAVSMRNCLAVNTHFFRISRFSLEKTIRTVMTVRNLLTKVPSLSVARDLITQEQGLMSAANVGNLFLLGQAFVIIREFTLEKSLMSAVNVGIFLLLALPSIVIREFTLERRLINVGDVGSLYL